MDQLDLEVAALKANALADATKKAYASYLQAYLSFCKTANLPALPASEVNIGRYIAFLYRSKSANSIPQYLTVIRLLHLEFGLPNPLQDNHHISSLIKGTKRLKGESLYKLTLTVGDLLAMKKYMSLNTPADAQLWSIILTCFYGLLRISNVTAPYASSWDPAKVIKRKDIIIKDSGCIISIRWSKTIQFKERLFHAALPRLDTPLCPRDALLHFLQIAGPIPADAPAWSYMTPSNTLNVPTPASIRPRLQSLVVAIGLPPAHYNTHSLRRSGASHLLTSGVPLETIKVLGDWRSDSVFKYLKPTSSQQLAIANMSFN